MNNNQKMMKYVSFLRGINIGGKNKISMTDLKESFIEAGSSDVSTYINSGNVIFSSLNEDEHQIATSYRKIILNKFNLDIPVAVVSQNSLSETIDKSPEWLNLGEEIIHYAIFAIHPTTTIEVFKEAGEIKPEYEMIPLHENVIFWSAPLKTFSKSKWSKIANSSMNNHVTIRNANTVNKIQQLMNE